MEPCQGARHQKFSGTTFVLERVLAKGHKFPTSVKARRAQTVQIQTDTLTSQYTAWPESHRRRELYPHTRSK